MSALDNSPADAAGSGYRSTGAIAAAEGEAYHLLVIGIPAPLSTWADCLVNGGALTWGQLGPPQSVS